MDRISRIEEFGNLGDFKYVGGDLFELRFNFGSGYRVYFSFISEKEIIIFYGGDKSSQKSDIKKAKKFLQELKDE